MKCKNKLLKILILSVAPSSFMITSCATAKPIIPTKNFDVNINVHNLKNYNISNHKAQIFEEFNTTITFDSSAYMFSSIEVTINNNKLTQNLHYLVTNSKSDINVKIFKYSITEENLTIDLKFDEVNKIPSNYLLIEDGDILAGITPDADLSKYNTLSIPSFVTSIKQKAFRTKFDSSSSIKFLIFENNSSIRTIGDWAFEKCVSICNEIVFPESLFSIGNDSFSGCDGLKNVLRFSNNITSIGDRAFARCSQISSIVFSESLETIGDYAFAECTNLHGNIIFSDAIKHIGNCAFQNCTNLDGEVTLGDSCQYIGDYAFENCINLKGNIFLSNELSYIGAGAFKNCYNISGNLIIPDHITTIYKDTFFNCFSVDDKLTIGSKVQEIGENAFTNISILGELEIPSSVKVIGKNAFKNCTSLSSIKFNNGLEKIEESAFQNCLGITSSIELPSSIKNIGDLAFQGCTNIVGKITIPSTCEHIGYGAFQGCKKLDEKLVLNNGLKKIDAYAFQNCESLIDDLSFPLTLQSIGSYAFENCYNISSISFGQNSDVKSIGLRAFNNCPEIEHVKNLKFCRLIDEEAFLNCTKLTCDIEEMDLQKKLTLSAEHIYKNAFQKCSNIKAINLIPSFGNINIHSYAFNECKNIEKIFIGEETNSTNALDKRPVNLSPYSFPNCEKLSELHFEKWDFKPSWAQQENPYIFNRAPKRGTIFVGNEENQTFWNNNKSFLNLGEWEVKIAH